jgi:hypothetical protein
MMDRRTTGRISVAGLYAGPVKSRRDHGNGQDIEIVTTPTLFRTRRVARAGKREVALLVEGGSSARRPAR